jgi:hypothetical protein
VIHPNSGKWVLGKAHVRRVASASAPKRRVWGLPANSAACYETTNCSASAMNSFKNGLDQLNHLFDFDGFSMPQAVTQSLLS